MRKLIFLVMIMIFSASTLFALENEVILKLGLSPFASLKSETTIDIHAGPDVTIKDETTNDTSISGLIGAEYYLYPFKYVAIGAGVAQYFNRVVQNMGNISYTNLFIAVKPRFFESGKENEEYAYLIGHFGYGFMKNDYKLQNLTLETDNGIYYAVGAGIQISNIIIEFLYSINKSEVKSSGTVMNPVNGLYYDASGKDEQTHASVNFNVGYRFGF